MALHDWFIYKQSHVRVTIRLESQEKPVKIKWSGKIRKLFVSQKSQGVLIKMLIIIKLINVI